MAASAMDSRSPTIVITQRLWSESISRSSSETPGIFMAATMASTTLLFRPSEKLGTHCTSVDMTGKNSGFTANGAKDGQLLEPIHPHHELHRVDAWVRNGQAGIGNMLILDPGSKGPALSVEELKAQRGMRKKVYVRGVQWNRVIAEKHSAAQFKERHSALRMGKVPL